MLLRNFPITGIPTSTISAFRGRTYKISMGVDFRSSYRISNSSVHLSLIQSALQDVPGCVDISIQDKTAARAFIPRLVFARISILVAAGRADL